MAYNTGSGYGRQPCPGASTHLYALRLEPRWRRNTTKPGSVLSVRAVPDHRQKERNRLRYNLCEWNHTVSIHRYRSNLFELKENNKNSFKYAINILTDLGRCSLGTLTTCGPVYWTMSHVFDPFSF